MHRPLILLSLLAAAAPAAAQNLLEVLEANLRIETRLFEGELERYDQARRREETAHKTLRTRSAELDRALRSGGARLGRLDELEAEVTEARESAFAASRELADLRQQLYGRMAALAELNAEIRREQGRRLVPASRLEGFWEIEIVPTGEVGLLQLRVEGTLITGTYRLSGQRTGSVRGTLADNQVDLERIDNSNGFDSVLEGKFNPATRQITGGWTAVDVSGGRPGGGTWKARKLSPAEEENLQVEQQP